jgi:hypothetical protein
MACGKFERTLLPDTMKYTSIPVKKDHHELKHHLEIPDADACMEGKQCVSLALEIDQLKKNIEGQQYWKF